MAFMYHMVSQFKSKINTMVTNSRKVKITCGNDEFVVKGVVLTKMGSNGRLDLWKQIFYLVKNYAFTTNSSLPQVIFTFLEFVTIVFILDLNCDTI